MWDAKSPQSCADDSLLANEQLLARCAALDEATRSSLRIDLGFLPTPLEVAGAATLGLNEFALHSWDVRALLDPSATIESSAVPLVVGVEAVMVGRICKPDRLGRAAAVRVELTDLDQSFVLVLAEHASVEDAPGVPDAVLRLPAEAWLRLATGRLAAAFTPDSVEVSGSSPSMNCGRSSPAIEPQLTRSADPYRHVGALAGPVEQVGHGKLLVSLTRSRSSALIRTGVTAGLPRAGRRRCR